MSQHLLLGLGTLLVSFLTSWAVTPAVIRLAHRVGAMDPPGPRKVHERPIPRIGGIAVAFGFFVGLVYAAYVTGALFSTAYVTIDWRWMGAASLGVFLLGLLDDLRGVSFGAKFAGQLAAALLAWTAGFRIEFLASPLGGTPLELGFWSLPLTVVWVVGITNAINLIDGLDGLAAGTALIVTCAVAVIAFHMGHNGVVATSIALVGSLLGFLRFNYNPALVFLGDSGSMFLGFVLAVISIRGSQKGATTVAVVAPLLVLGLPILDTSLAVLRRLSSLGRESAGSGRRLLYVVRNSRRVFQPDRAHLHHRLLDLGLSHRSAVLALYACAAVLALAALASVVANSLRLALALVATVGAGSAGLVLYQRFVRDRGNGRPGQHLAEVPERPRASSKIRSVRRVQSP